MSFVVERLGRRSPHPAHQSNEGVSPQEAPFFCKDYPRSLLVLSLESHGKRDGPTPVAPNAGRCGSLSSSRKAVSLAFAYNRAVPSVSIKCR